MLLTRNEILAVFKLGQMMCLADGTLEETEMQILVDVISKYWGFSLNREQFLNDANLLEPTDALAKVAVLNDEKKRYVTGYLAAIMCADGNISEPEMALWRLVSTLCGLPTMSLGEALLVFKACQ